MSGHSRLSAEKSSENSIVAAAIEAFYEMVPPRCQGVHLVKAASSGAKSGTLLAMEFLEMQINVLRVLRVGGKIVCRTW
jgi:hypothetical protein